MKLSQLIHEVWKDEEVRKLEVRLRKDEIRTIVNATIKHIGLGLLQHGVIKLQGLFTLKIKQAKGRNMRNPITKELMRSNDYNKINIKPSKLLDEGLKKFKK
ncbi:HU family DNA-binding protein [Priestia aryabhattai]|uniref:HU family DNA-binding protein n=1 Tax=Priestia aryabhattai TaxID=412384 RepID=UPI00399F3893